MSGPSRFLKPGVALPLFFFLLTTVYIVAIFDIRSQFAGDGGVGPRTVPMLAAFCMYIALSVVLVQEWRSAPHSERGKPFWKGLWRPLGVVAATAVYIFVFRTLGYAISTLAFVAALFAVFDFERRRPFRFCASAVLVTAVFYGLFAGVFGVQLPTLTEGWL